MNEELLAKAIEIRDEKKGNQNSATRVGRLFIDVINKLNPGYGYMGMVTPSVSPAQTTQKCFYQASSPGTYVNFGALVVKEGEMAYLLWDGISWRKETYFDIVNDLITGGADKALSAEMGKVLDEYNSIISKVCIINGYMSPSDGVTVITSSASYNVSSKYILVEEGKLYRLHGMSNLTRTVYFYKSDREFIKYDTWFGSNDCFTTPLGCTYIRISFRGQNITKDNFDYTICIKEDNLLNSFSYFQSRSLSIIGDSISTYKDYIIDSYKSHYPADDVNSVQKTYWKRIMDIVGGEIEVNASYASSTVTNKRQSAGYPSLCDRVNVLGNPDTIIIALGTNDSTDNVPLGDYDFDSNVSELDEQYFRNAYIKGIKMLQSAYPSAKLILISFSMGDDYKESIAFIANHYDLPYIDCSDNDTYDGKHPSYSGMLQACSQLSNYILNGPINSIKNDISKTQESVGCLSVLKSGYIGIDNGVISNHATRVYCPYYFRVNPSSTYEIVGYKTGLLVLISRYDEDKNYIGYTGYFTEQSSIEIPSDTYYIRISLSEIVDGMRLEDISYNPDILNLEANYDIANIELELYKDSKYVGISGKEQTSTTKYGISLYNAQKGDIIIFRCVATNQVAVISEYTNSSYIPIVLGNSSVSDTSPAPSTSRYCVTKDMTLALSGQIGSTSLMEYYLKVYTPKNAATDNAERALFNSKLNALEANQYRLSIITNYSESAEVNQIVDGVVSSSTTNTRRIYYAQLKKGNVVVLKGDISNTTKFVEWGFYSDVPNINSVAIDYGKVNVLGENTVYYTAPQDGYLAVAVNLSYHKGWSFYNAFSFSNYPLNNTSKLYNPSNIKYIPHRGVRSSEIPENTSYSVMHAALYGIKYSECDVRYTSDGVGVVMHDTTINRTMFKNDLSEIGTDTTVSDNTYEYLSQFVYKSTNPTYRTGLQTMREYIDSCAYWNVCPIIQGAMSDSDLHYCMNRLGDNWICYGGNWEKVRAYSSNVLFLTSSNYDTVDLMLERFKVIGGNVGISKLFNTELTDEIISACRENHYEIMASYAYDKANIPDAIRRGATIVLSDNVGREIRKVLISSDSGWGDFIHNGSITGNHVSITSGQYINYAIDKKGIYKVFIEFEGEGQCTLPSYNNSGVFEEVSFIMTGGVFQYNLLYLENSSYTISIDANTDMKIKRVIIFYEES